MTDKAARETREFLKVTLIAYSLAWLMTGSSAASLLYSNGHNALPIVGILCGLGAVALVSPALWSALFSSQEGQ